MSDCDDGAKSSDVVHRTRGRRSKSDKSGRSEALERFRSVRAGGGKHKYEVQEVQNVYDIVDESTYSRRVTDRQRDDWIVDDGTGEYVEDGREIFDDDINDRDEETDRKQPKNKKEQAAKKAEAKSHKAGFASVRDMLASIPVKRKHPDTTRPTIDASRPQFSANDLLAEVMEDLNPHKKREKAQTPFCSLTQAPSVSSSIQVSSTRSLTQAPSLSPLTKVPSSCSVTQAPSLSSLTKVPSSCLVTQAPSLSSLTKVSSSFSVTQAPSLSSLTKVPSSCSVTQAPSLSSLTKVPSFSSFLSPVLNEGMENIAIEFEDSDVKLLEEGDSDMNILNFFWLDIFEEPKNPGVLYLFGKVQRKPADSYVSACIVVKDLSRSIHLLIRDNMKSDASVPVDGVDVYNEFNEVIAPKFKIKEFKSRPVQKRYCFDIPDIPSVAQYIEIRYSAALPPLPADLDGETFSHAFGTGNSMMENFLLEKKLKGPAWLEIRNARKVELVQCHSWCKLEFSCSVGDIRLNEKSSEMSTPPLVLASINIQSISDTDSKRDTIIFAGVAFHNAFDVNVPLSPNHLFHSYFCLLNKPQSEMWPLDVDEVFLQDASKNNASKMESERALLGCLLAKLQQIDADIYLGHDLNFDLLLLHLYNLKVPHWSRLGRLKRTNTISKNGKAIDYKSALAGRLYCDVKTSAMELIRARSYDFQNLTSQVLGIQTESLTGPEMKERFGSASGLQSLINWGMQYCVINIRLVNELQVLPLALQITTIAGNTLARTLLGGRSERNEYLLLHAFHSKGFLVPDKHRPFVKNGKTEGEITKGDKKSSGGPSYIGGMVLDPKKGFYDNFIVLMDFNSLYPSIIQEYNICFTTRSQAGSDYGCTDDQEGKGILPEEIRKLVESRRQVKAMMKDPKLTSEQLKVYDIRQMALKLTANSMYGCLGFKNSRFYAKELAASITGHGRDILLKTKDAVERMGYEVIYGDTDSLMINSNTIDISKVFAIGNQIKAEVNKMYKLLELEIDGIFRFLLLLKKKKYAALVHNQKNGEITTSLELKGLDMVRRDWAPIASNTARLILEEIMSEQPLDEKVFKICVILGEVAQKLKSGNFPLTDLLITKQLAKHPEEYKDAQGLYHVQVALKMNKTGTLAKKFRNGDTVSYLFCTDGLPHHISELPANRNPGQNGEETGEVKHLMPDPKYYLAHQIHPVVSRICEPIEGLDAGRIAEELGMDASSFKRRRVIDDQDDKALGQETESEKFVDCEKFSFNCPLPNCGKQILHDSIFTGTNAEIHFAMMKCQECGGTLLPFREHILNCLVLFLRKFVNKLYFNEYICEDPTCDNVERGVPFSLVNGFPPCRRCGQGLMCRDYNESHLYKQLTYLFDVFNLEKQIEMINENEKVRIRELIVESSEVIELTRFFEVVKALIGQRLQSSGFSEIKLGTLFQGLYPTNIKHNLFT